MPSIISISHDRKLMDEPNGRTVHESPVPRLGGVSFFPLILMSIFLFNGLCVSFLDVQVSAGDTSAFFQMQYLGIGLTLLYLIGVADDLVGVGFKKKFLIQFITACLFPLSDRKSVV